MITIVFDQIIVKRRNMNTCSLQGWFLILQDWYTGFDLIQLFLLTPTRRCSESRKEDDKGREKRALMGMGEGIKLLRNSVPPSRVSLRSASVLPLPAGRSYSIHRAKFVLFLPARWCEKVGGKVSCEGNKGPDGVGGYGCLLFVL